ncbi:MAG: hypothetical protein J0H14_05780 [Alphaproteobacteria bacterium]|nr:hypothetical protein [Alphaproteobacteria bacterium]
MPNFELQDAPGFEGRFRVVPVVPLAPTEDERLFVRRLEQLMDFLADLGDPNDPLARIKLAARADVLGRLRTVATAFVAEQVAPADAVRAIYVIQGRWQAAVDQIRELPFAVEELNAQGQVIPRGGTAPTCDLRITVFNQPIGTAKLDFKVDVDRTLTIIKVVLGKSGARWRTRSRNAYDKRRRANYIHQLAGIARVGLQGREPSLTTLASQSLLSLRQEFVAMEAGTVKNRYLRRLGWRCLVAAILSGGGYYLCRVGGPVDWPVPYAFRNFFLLTAGTAVGTWLSFSLRRVILTFLDLAALEEDQMDPTNRVLFIIALASVVGLLFWAGAVSIGIGDFQSGPAIFRYGAWALLMGLLLGIAERAMATAVSKRATDFAGAIGGK